MNLTRTQHACPQCGEALSETAPAGLCRKCLFAEMLPEERGVLGILGDYEVFERIARGGMGSVYRARQRTLNREVALKLVHSGRFAGERERRRFTLEAEYAAALDHPNIVPVYETGEEDGQLFYSMRLEEGGTLADHLAGFHEPFTAAGVLEKVARAVHAAHLQGILHRDLKPGNILLGATGEPQVSDFGLAKRLDGDGALTLSGEVVGSPSYLAPEVAFGKGPPSVGSDVYSLGVLLYELLSGKPPFVSNTALESLRLAAEAQPAPLSKVPVDLESICLKCLSKDPANRYDSAATLADDLARFQRGDPVGARPVGGLKRAWKWARRNPGVAVPSGAAAVLLATLAVGGIAAAVAIGRSRDSERTARVEATQRLADMTLEQGLEDCEEGRITEGVVQFGEAHRISETGSEPHRSALRLIEGWSVSVPEILACHDGRIRHLGMTSDGTGIVSIGRDGTVRLTDVPTGATRTSVSLGCTLDYADFDPDSGMVAVGSIWGGLAVCDLTENGEMHWLIPEHAEERRATRVEGAFGHGPTAGLFVAATPESMTVWRIPQGEKVASLAAPGGSVVFSPDGGRMLSGIGWHKKGSTQMDAPAPTLWDAARWEPITNFELDGAPALSGAFSPCGKFIAIGTGSQDASDHIGIWDAKTGQRMALRHHRNHVSAVGFSPDGRQVLSVSRDGTAAIMDWEPLARTLVSKPALRHDGAVTHGAFSRDGTCVATGGGNEHAVRLWKARDGTPLAVWRLDSPVSRFLFQPDGNRLLVGTVSGNIHFGQLPTPPLSRFCSEPTVCAIHPDGNLCYVGGRGFLEARALGSPDEVATAFSLPADTRLDRLALSADGTLLAGGGRDGYARIWETKSGKEIAAFRHPGMVGYVNFDPIESGGAVLLTACIADGLLRKWTVADHVDPLADAPSATSVSSVIALDGHYYAGCYDGTLRELGADLRVERNFLKPHEGNVGALAVSRDGSSLASTGTDFVARLHDVATGEPFGEDMRHSSYMLGIEFTPDGRFLATSCLDGGVRLWDARTGRLCREWFVRRGVRAHGLAMDAGGRFLVAVYSDGTLRRWHVPPSLPANVDSVTAHVEKATRLRWIPEKNRSRRMTAAEWNALAK